VDDAILLFYEGKVPLCLLSLQKGDSPMKIVTLIARLLLGLMFVIFGLNGFLHFIPQPPMPDSPAARFATLLATVHYMDFVCALQLVSGILFLVNRFVPLALVLIGPVIVNILLFHVLMAPGSIAPGLVATVLWFIVFASVRSACSGIFQQKVTA
jgi:putative oxidoreductase